MSDRRNGVPPASLGGQVAFWVGCWIVLAAFWLLLVDTIKTLQKTYNLTVLMAEQNFNQAIRIADRGYVIVHGRIAFEGKSADELNNNDLIRKFYMGL